jgi:16S rRNA (cytidine1402-2'-O)-methyltransferase
VTRAAHDPESAAGHRAGVLRVVATPIGNLADLSPRAREALASADVIAAEDTRRSGKLLELLGLPKKPFLSYYAPREREKARAIVERLVAGDDVALVTDGGTPGVADPGAVVVAAARAAGIRVEPVPGPCAVAVALSASSFGGEGFVFEGFLPAKPAARRRRIRDLARETRTIVLYEAPHRLTACLRDLGSELGGSRRGTVVREATKIHEEVAEGTLEQLAAKFAGDVRGEVVLVLEGGTAVRDVTDSVEVETAKLLAWAMALGLSPDRAAREVAAVTGLPRSRLVRRARGSATRD